MLLSEAAAVTDAGLNGSDRRFRGCSTDSRTIGAGQLFIALRGGRFDGHEFVPAAAAAGAAGAMVERGTGSHNLPTLVVEGTLGAMGRLASHWRSRVSIPLVAVTGSNGKTTVKEMLASVLSQQAPVLATRGNLNNEVGVPLTLFGLAPSHRFAVVEMGANHPGEIRRLSALVHPTVAVITQCAPAHLEGFGSADGVAAAKAEVFEGLLPGGTAVLNADDRYCEFWRERSRRFRQLRFGLREDAEVTAGEIAPLAAAGRVRFRLRTPAGETQVQLALAGRHNVANALAAAGCAGALGIPLERIRAGLEAVRALKGRLQLKAAVNSASLLDDTYNANPASLGAALEVLREMPGRRWLVLGDMGELGQSGEKLHQEAGERALAAGIERLFTVGSLSRLAAEAFGRGARHFRDREELAAALRADLENGTTVLVKGSRAMELERVVDALTAGG